MHILASISSSKFSISKNTHTTMIFICKNSPSSSDVVSDRLPVFSGTFQQVSFRNIPKGTHEGHLYVTGLF